MEGAPIEPEPNPAYSVAQFPCRARGAIAESTAAAPM